MNGWMDGCIAIMGFVQSDGTGNVCRDRERGDTQEKSTGLDCGASGDLVLVVLVPWSFTILEGKTRKTETM